MRMVDGDKFLLRETSKSVTVSLDAGNGATLWLVQNLLKCINPTVYVARVEVTRECSSSFVSCCLRVHSASQGLEWGVVGPVGQGRKKCKLLPRDGIRYGVRNARSVFKCDCEIPLGDCEEEKT